MNYDSITSQSSTSNYICKFECIAFSLRDTIDLQYLEVSNFNFSKVKYDLENNFTFVIPIKVDCIERESNLKTVLRFINDNFKNYKTIVSEQSSEQSLVSQKDYDVFYYNSKSAYHKTKCVNDAVKLIKTQFGCMYDSDYITTPSSFYHCYLKLKEGYDFAHPSIGMNIYFNKHHTYLFNKHNKLPLQSEIDYHHFFDPAHYPGLCFMFNLSSYFEIGLENENFITWGFEDHERFIRIEKLNKRVYYSPGCGYHLWHPRKSDFYYKVRFIDDKIVDSFDNQKQINELIKINEMSKEEIIEYINSWGWNESDCLAR